MNQKKHNLLNIFKFYYTFNFMLYFGDWGLGIGDWGLGIGSNPQSPIPNPQSPIPMFKEEKNINYKFVLH